MTSKRYKLEPRNVAHTPYIMNQTDRASKLRALLETALEAGEEVQITVTRGGKIPAVMLTESALQKLKKALKLIHKWADVLVLTESLLRSDADMFHTALNDIELSLKFLDKDGFTQIDPLENNLVENIADLLHDYNIYNLE